MGYNFCTVAILQTLAGLKFGGWFLDMHLLRENFACRSCELSADRKVFSYPTKIFYHLYSTILCMDSISLMSTTDKMAKCYLKEDTNILFIIVPIKNNLLSFVI